MRFSIVILLGLLLGGNIRAQEMIPPTGKLVGGVFEEKTSTVLIQFKANHHYYLKKMDNNGHKTQKLKGTWVMEDNKLILVDKKSGQQYLVLEKQKDEWYVRDEGKKYSIKGKFFAYTKNEKFRMGQGC